MTFGMYFVIPHWWATVVIVAVFMTVVLALVAAIWAFFRKDRDGCQSSEILQDVDRSLKIRENSVYTARGTN